MEMFALYIATPDAKEKEDNFTEIYTTCYGRMNDMKFTTSRDDILNCKEATGNPGIHRKHIVLISDPDK